MTFATDLAALPTHAAQAEARGFLPPIIRAQGHLMAVLLQVADDTATPNDEELLTELKDAKGHWDAINPADALSATTDKTIKTYGAAIGSAITEWPKWDQKARVKNLRDLASRAASLTVVLDRELVGLTNSDAGHNL